MSSGRLANKRIVIIGGTAGIGLSAALACIREGAEVIVTGRDEDHVRNAAAQLSNKGRAIVSDATIESSAQAAIQLCHDTFGGFDALYHVAGGSGRKYGDGPLHELTLEGWNKTFEINLTGLMLSNKAAISYFLKHLQS